MTKFIYTSKIHSNESINYFLIDKEKVGIKKLKNPKAFIDFPQTIADVYEKLQYYNTMKKKRVLTLFNDMIGNMETNKR